PPHLRLVNDGRRDDQQNPLISQDRKLRIGVAAASGTRQILPPQPKLPPSSSRNRQESHRKPRSLTIGDRPLDVDSARIAAVQRADGPSEGVRPCRTERGDRRVASVSWTW